MISFVYLDVGGVAQLDLTDTPKKWADLRAELGIMPSQKAAFEEFWRLHEPEIATTRDVQTLVPILNHEFGLHIPDSYSLLDAFVRRFEPNPSIRPVVDVMKAALPVGLLTNMYVGMFAAIQKRGILPNVQWDVVVDSTVERCQKPDAKIFEIAEAKAGVPCKDILFVENGAGHVAAAKALGWQTFLYDPSKPEQSSKDLLAFFQKNLPA